MSHSMFSLRMGDRVEILAGPFYGTTGTVIGSQIHSASYGELSVRFDHPQRGTSALFPECALRSI